MPKRFFCAVKSECVLSTCPVLSHDVHHNTKQGLHGVIGTRLQMTADIEYLHCQGLSRARQ